MLQVQVYSIRPLEPSVRVSFRLTEDPYTSINARDYLKSLGVVFFRDERHGFGIIIEPDDGDPVSITERVGWAGFKSSCELDDTGHVQEWERHVSTEVKYAKILKKHGDARMWLHWNKEHRMLKLTQDDVKVS